MFGMHDRRQELRGNVEDWLNRHQDPADPLTRPVELLLQMYIVGTNLTAVFLVGLGGAVLALTFVAIAMIVSTRSHTQRVVVPRGEQQAMQAWVDSGQASRLMRCEADGLMFENGRCRATDAGWLIPLEAQSRLAAAGMDNAMASSAAPEQPSATSASRQQRAGQR